MVHPIGVARPCAALCSVHGHTSHAPPIHVDIPLADLVEFQEMLAWWRQRKHVLSLAAEAPAPTERWTLYIEKPFIERIKAEAEAERVKVTEVINRIIRHYYTCH